jgi:hypothetical protein
MIKNWQKFNESYDQGSIEFTREEARAFSTYIKDDLMSWFSVKAEKELKEVIQEFLLIFNEEFDSNLSVDDTQIEMIIIEPLTIESPYSYRSLTPAAISQSCNLIWELLKYKNYKPAFGVRFKFPNDEDLNQKRYVSYYNKVLNNLNIIPNTTIKTEMGEVTNKHSSLVSGYLPFYLFLRFESFEFNDPFSKDNVIEFIESHPEHVNSLYKWADKDEIFDFIVDHPEIKSQLKGQNLLDFTKKYKSINDPQRTQMESENQMYIFIARPSFKEQPDGNYKKDIEIENLVAIDPYDSKDAYALSMMKLRARMQSNNSEVYCIWLPKDDFEKDDLRKINDDSMTYLRKLIDQKKQKV